MTNLSRHDIEHIFEKLRYGLVPERGLDTFAEGIERQRNELHRLFGLAERGEGLVKFLRAEYGGGKSFLARLATLDAQARGFATSFVVVSDNDLKFYRFDDVYAKVVQQLATDMCPRGALSDILDRWIGRVEDMMINGGVDEDDPDFDEKLRERLGQEIQSMTQGKAPEDFVRVIRTIFQLKEEGELVEAGALLSWLSGSKNVASSAKRRAQVKGDVESRTALAYLHGINEIVKEAGYKGLLIVIDEVETILRSRKDTRHKSLNGIRQIADASSQYPGLIWLFTGTPEFFDTRRGVAGLEALHERIKFNKQGDFASSRQPQLELHPFDRQRLRDVALKLRELYPTGDRYRLEQKITVDFIEQLVDSVVEGFRGDVGVVPRQFLRAFVDHMDLVEEHSDYDPFRDGGFTPTRDDESFAPEEEVAAGFKSAIQVEDDENDLVPAVDQW